MIETVRSKKILLLENIHPAAANLLKSGGFNVEILSKALGESEIIKAMTSDDYIALGVRSKTYLTLEVLEKIKNVSVVGAFCIGTNQINLSQGNKLGIPVFNAPYSSTRSVAELVIGEIIALARRLFDVSKKAHEGLWDKSAKNCYTIRGKTLGIVGYGHIGSQVSVLAESMGLNVVYYDTIKTLPLGNSRALTSLDELLKNSDFVTLHVPETANTKNMITKKQLLMMKPGSYLINASRGTVVVIEDLVSVLKSNHLHGAAVDVYPQEPESNDEKFKTELQSLPNVILTPHIGGSTEEAQEAIGLEVAESMLRFLTLGSTYGAVNFPSIDVQPKKPSCQRIINVHQNVPGVLGEINSIVSKAGVNIESQQLATDPQIGYLVMDFARGQIETMAKNISQLPTSIKTHVL
ncbi:MAG: phosphoglycerate dehydrogenase [Pseudomonadota bacterium]|nr:phosphoglycerate dehydrogenase [Pseudomonadota bacterium]